MPILPVLLYISEPKITPPIFSWLSALVSNESRFVPITIFFEPEVFAPALFPIKTLLFDVNQYYKFVVAGGYPLQLLTHNSSSHISMQVDIDVFLVCTDNKATVEKKQKAREHAVNYFIQHIYKNIPNDKKTEK